MSHRQRDPLAMELAAERIGPDVLVRLNQEQLAKELERAMDRARIDVAFNRAEVAEHRLLTHRAEVRAAALLAVLREAVAEIEHGSHLTAGHPTLERFKAVVASEGGAS